MTADEVADLLVAAVEKEWDRLFPHKALPAWMGDSISTSIWSTLLQDDFFYDGETKDVKVTGQD